MVVVFKVMLLLLLNMCDVNCNEKVFDFLFDFLMVDVFLCMICIGDLMIWSFCMVVVFYKSFFMFYSYMRFGKIEDFEGLVEVFGVGNVIVFFELK